MKFRVQITETCLSLLEKISDKKIRESILTKIESLKNDPHRQGKALLGNLQGFRSIRTAGRYRVVYSVNLDSRVVVAMVVGMRKEGDRKDIYEVARKLLKARLLD
ncbi:MAG: type II toxin-antitoxin system RelE/ParE family toxin [Deltaproteobacteria bacterium]|nr:type II toxin-antitoxin system RelE/ParE family toxin [Deltaproteobacteria bacterium]MBW1923654.1 type II toxin-antitoxin system RelE/ParE family toxin [Deltaproteobacteria bacterium]MBW1950348.1 type II toxin-antitoxin system RelE/ParE family toxin [Deltaproteobacteria bacterium]MBW2349008.1 type II toxin-antitoxin system RelE/ParE family toxin [Deltaproteobacteria bacterium]RLB36387.1 MAG: type II toxin-antitoxin system RelE/ParE family toxin [Deltaproteobacteria bacterium]